METNTVRLGHTKATFIISINFFVILAVSAHASQQERPADESLSSQSQRFWQLQNQRLEAPAANPVLQTPISILEQRGRVSEKAINQEQEEELERGMYRRAFNQVLSRDLSARAQVHVQRFLRYLEEQVSVEVKQCLPVRLVEKIPAFLINTYKFQIGDSPIESSKKLTQLGLGIINTPLLLSQAEKNNLAALAFSAAGYRALKMEDDVPCVDKCNFYLSVTQLFVWSSHRYQNLWAKRLLLDKASGLLGQALLALEYVVEPDQNTELSKTLAKELVNVWGRYQKLVPQGEEKAI